MIVLGINGAYHESSACLLRDGKIVCAVEEERLNRRKHAKSAVPATGSDLPLAAIQWCLHSEGVTWGDIDRIGYSFRPELRLQNVLSGERWVQNGDWGSEAGERLFVDELAKCPSILSSVAGQDLTGKWTWLDHHLCHLASAYFASGFEHAAVLSVDGIGEFVTTGLAEGRRNRLSIHKTYRYPNSLGFVWEKFCKYLGYDEYAACTIMSLAAFGKPETYRAVMEELIRFSKEDGLVVAQDRFHFRSEDCSRLEDLLRLPRSERPSGTGQLYADVAAALQARTEDMMLALVEEAVNLAGSRSLCLSGGVALNCVANGRILHSGLVDKFYIQPVAHDAGTAIGAAYCLWNEASPVAPAMPMPHAFLGPQIEEEGAAEALRRRGVAFSRPADMPRVVAGLLAAQKMVGWCQGAMEMGPRALGHRSILSDPRDHRCKQRLDSSIKFREHFRPYSPSVLAENVAEWFAVEQDRTSALDYMLIACSVRQHQRDRIPAVIHVDGSSRIHVVHQHVDPLYYAMINEFRGLTGVPMVLNTSFNSREPIVATPEDAIRAFLETDLDALALGPLLAVKKGR